jgi:mono/diheme cytochrome c family protein
MDRIAAALLMMLAVSGCATTGAGSHFTGSAEAREGGVIAQAKCAACHTISGATASPLARTPTFAQIHKRHGQRGLLWELEAINEVGHYEMPATPLSASEMRSLVAYIHRGRGG